MILDDPPDGTDRLEPHRGIGRPRQEAGVELGRQLVVGGDRDVVPLLLVPLRRGGRRERAARREAPGIRRGAGRQRHRADVRIELAHRSPREVAEVGALAGPGLVVGHVGITPHVDQATALLEHRDREITAEAVGVVDVEHRGEGLARRVDARDRLDLLVVERERVPVDVGRGGDPAGDADRVAVGLEQVADVLGIGERVVHAAGVLARLAREERVAGQPLNVDPHRGVADVGVADGRTGLLIGLPQADAELVAARRHPGGEVGRIGERGLVVHRRGGGVGARLAPHADEVRRAGADGAGQHDPHAGIAGVERVEVAALRGTLAQGLGDAAGRGREPGRGMPVLQLDRRGQCGGVGDRELAGGRVELAGHGGRRRLIQQGAKREHARGIGGERLDGDGVRPRQIPDHPGQRLGDGPGLVERVDGRGGCADIKLDLAVRQAGLQRRVGGAGQHVARRIDQFDHRVEARRRLVDVDPDLRAGGPGELVGVDVRRRVGRDESVDLEAEPPVRVARLLLGVVDRGRARGKVGCEHAERLGVGDGVVLAEAAGEGHLRLQGDRHVAIVGVGHEREAAPVVGRGRREGAVGVGVLDDVAERVEAGPHGVVAERRDDHRIAGLAENLHRAADAVVDVEPVARGREAGGAAEQFDHQALGRLAHEPQAGRRVEVLDDDLARQHVRDVGVVPDALDGDLLAAHDQAGGGPAIRRIRHPVFADQRPEIVVVPRGAVDQPRAPAAVRQLDVRERVGVDADHGAGIRAEVVAHDDRLGTADEDGRRVVGPAAAAARSRPARGVVLEPAVRQPQLGLMRLDHVEGVEGALDRSGAAAERQIGLVDAHRGTGIGDDPAPVTDGQRAHGGPEGVELVGLIAVGVEGAGRAEAVVAERRDDHPLARGTLRDQLRRAALELDPGTLQLHDHAGIDGQPAAVSGHDHAAAVGIEVTAGAPVDDEVLLEHVDHVGAPQAGGHAQVLERPAEAGVDLDEQPVDGVVGEPIAAEFGADPAGGVFEGIGGGGERRARTPRHAAEGDRRPGALELNRGERGELGVDHHLAATEGDRSLADRVDERLLRGGVGIRAEHEAAPLAAGGLRPHAVGVAAHAVVVVRREDRALARDAEHLERGPRPRRAGERRRTAHVHDGGPELEDRPGIDHRGHALGNHERGAVGQRPVRERRADEVGRVLVIAEDPHERPRPHGVERRLDGRIRGRERPGAPRRGDLVDEHGVGQRRGAEPEGEGAAGRAVAVAVERCSGDVHHRGAGRGRGREPESRLVRALGAAAIARIGQLGVEGGVAHARHPEEVGAPLEGQPHEGIPPVVVVVPRDQRPHRPAVDDVLAVQREHAVERAGDLLARAGDHRLGGKGSRLRQLEAIEVDVAAVGLIELPEVDGVVVAGEHRFAGQPAAHDRGQVVGVVEPERVPDLVHRDVEPIAAVLAQAPVDGRVEHHVVAATEAGDTGHGGVRVEGPQIARGDADPVRRRFDEPNAGHAAEQLEHLAGPLLLVLRDDVLKRIALGIDAVVGLEVVFDHGDAGRGIDRGERESVGAAVDRRVAMTGLVHRAGLTREADAAQRCGHRRPGIDGPGHRRDRGGGRAARRAAQQAEVLRGRERGVVVAALRLRIERRDRAAAHLQAIELPVGQVGGELQPGPAGDGVEGHQARGEGGARVVAVVIDLDHAIHGGVRHRLELQRFVGVEIDVDRVARLGERPGHAGHRLGNDGRHERAQLETQVDRRGVHAAAVAGAEARSDHDLVGVVRQGVLEPDHDLVAVGGVVDEDAAELDRHVGEGATGSEGIAPAAAPPHRDRTERGGAAVDHHARAEPEGDLLR